MLQLQATACLDLELQAITCQSRVCFSLHSCICFTNSYTQLHTFQKTCKYHRITLPVLCDKIRAITVRKRGCYTFARCKVRSKVILGSSRSRVMSSDLCIPHVFQRRSIVLLSVISRPTLSSLAQAALNTLLRSCIPHVQSRRMSTVPQVFGDGV